MCEDMTYVLITGATSGIGAQVAQECVKNGYTPILVGRSLDKLIAMQKKLQEQFQVNSPIFQLDLLELDKIQPKIHEILSQYDVDVLINNAGYGKFESVVDSRLENIHGMFQVNVIALALIAQAVLRKMKEKKHGHIMNIASLAGKMATANASAYAASKHAVIGFSNALRLEARQEGVYVTTVNLGPVATNFFQVADATGQYEKKMQRYLLKSHDVAKRIVSIIGKNKREVNMPYWMGVGAKLYQVCPAFVEMILGNRMRMK